MSITRINEFTAAPEKADALHAFLTELKEYILSSSGCQSCEILRSQDDERQFAVIEKWDSVDAHQQSIVKYPKEQMHQAMTLLGDTPKGTYYQE